MNMNSLARLFRCLATLAGVGVVAALTAPADGMPQKQPKLLTIVREEVKVGRGAEHARHEAGWPAAYEKAKSPDYYLALVAMTGPNETWYLIPSDSHAAIGEAMKREDKDPVLSAELARLALADAEYVNSVKTVQTMARPDLSLGAFPDLAKARFFEVTTFRVKLGRAEESDLFEHLRNAEIIPRRDLKEKNPPKDFRDVQLEKAVQHLRETAK